MGTVMVVMQPVAHKVELREQLTITNYKGAEVGVMNVSSSSYHQRTLSTLEMFNNTIEI